MKIGITYDLKDESLLNGSHPDGLPDDLQEEFDSPITIESIAQVLRDLGHTVHKLGDGPEMLKRLLADPPDFVFNFAEGQGVGRSREARVPAVLEMLGIPYSGSDPLTLAATLDKDCAKRLVSTAGVSVPRGALIQLDDDPILAVEQTAVPFPVVVKPAWEGSSKGIRSKCLVDRPDSLPQVVASLRRDHRQPILIEEFIQGEELTVGILGNTPPRVLGVMRVVPVKPTDRFIYSLEVKRDYLRQVRYEVPPALPASDLEAVEQAALTAYRILGCRDVSRVDFRLRNGVPYFLEVNPLPGLNPESSDLVLIALQVGWTHAQLIEAILQAALDRHPSLVSCQAASRL
jgi:D-alanine-D-alanine ligase